MNATVLEALRALVQMRLANVHAILDTLVPNVTNVAPTPSNHRHPSVQVCKY